MARNSIANTIIDLKINKNCDTAIVKEKCGVLCKSDCDASSIEREDRNLIEWMLSESMLSLLWDDVFQRAVVYQWCFDEEKDEPKNKGKYIHKKVRRKARELRKHEDYALLKEEYIEKNGTPIPPYGSANPDIGKLYLLFMMELINADPGIKDEYKGRLPELADYLKEDESIPIYILNGIGYDYILSSDGIELVLPDRPLTDENDSFLAEVYRLYEIRQAGRNVLLVPPTEDKNKEIGRLDTVRLYDSDNNIEQIRINLPDMLENLATDKSFYFYQTARDEKSNVKDKKLHDFDYNTEIRKVISSELEDSKPTDADLFKKFKEAYINFFDETGSPNSGAPLKMHEFFGKSELILLFSILERPFEERSYTFIRDMTRCWQLSGSIFRRIAHEMPRVKAEIWLARLNHTKLSKDFDETFEEHLKGIADTVSKKVEKRFKKSLAKKAINNKVDRKKLKKDIEDQVKEKIRKKLELKLHRSLRKLEDRYFNNANNGCREIFQERLEITLPEADTMYFRGLHEKEAPEHDQIMIHNCGITLPRVSNGPSKEFVYETWRNGIAANPVFTDSNPS